MKLPIMPSPTGYSLKQLEAYGAACVEHHLRPAAAPKKNHGLHLDAFIRWQRRSRGFTLRQLSKASGLSESYISNLERGHRANITLLDAVALANAFKIPLDGLIEAADNTKYNA